MSAPAGAFFSEPKIATLGSSSIEIAASVFAAQNLDLDLHRCLDLDPALRPGGEAARVPDPEPDPGP